MSKSFWLDLEIREDIDDYLALVYFLDTDVKIKAISIDNPSMNELSVVNNLLKKYNRDIPIVISGEITMYSRDKDINRALYPYKSSESKFPVKHLEDYLDTNIDLRDTTIFCGGSLKTLSEILKKFPYIHFEACIQGGFAGKKIVGEENTLKKFKNRNEVPTWNLNLDIESTEYVLSAENLTSRFVSKNICHGSWISLSGVSNVDCHFNNVLRSYLKSSFKNKKCMHDLLAAMTLFNNIVDFKYIELKNNKETKEDDSIIKWHSIISDNKSKEISISLDYNRFLYLILNYNGLVKNCICGLNFSDESTILDSLYPTNIERTSWNFCCQTHNLGCGRVVYSNDKESLIKKWNEGITDEILD